MKRKPISKNASKKMFTKTADHIHKKNYHPVIMRGGYAL